MIRVTAILLPLLVLSGCSGTAVRNGEGDSVATILAQPYDGPRHRIVIAPLRDHSSGEESIGEQLALLVDTDEPPSAGAILGGIHELMTNALFNSGRFILLEREGLDAVLAEQQFNSPLDDATQATLEGAEFLLLGAVTAFDTGQSGGFAFPIPIPLGDNGDFGVLDVEMRTAYVAMDLRLVEIKSGRVVNTTAVEGKTRKFGIGLAHLFSVGGSHLQLPGLLSFYQNTPMEQAIMKMTVAATRSLAESLDPSLKQQRETAEMEALLP
ncbi:MAG: CsgG/HfaB family protein [Chromatiales bacterium]|nr:CsgG/HfaB family protein [Chromatiales bacterium]